MKAVVVYESYWGNTAAIARAIAEGLGADARALATDEATPTALEGAALIVAGAPVMAFRLPSDAMIGSLADKASAAGGADLGHPSMRAWLGRLPAGSAATASFETAFRWSPGGATGQIDRAFGSRGYRRAAKSQRFVVTGTEGPLRVGELERARAWGAQLARIAA